MKYKIIMIILILIGLLIGAYLMFYMDAVPTYSLEEYKEKMGFYDSMVNIDIIYFQNYDYLKDNYKGEVDLYYLVDSFNILIKSYFEQVQNQTKDLSSEELKEYFDNNKTKIGIKLGLTEFEDFEEFVEYIKDKKISINEYQYSELDKETLSDNERYVNFTLNMYYDNDIKLTFNVRLSNIDNTEEPIIKFIPVKEEL